VKDIRPKLLATFQIEHSDHVEQIRALLLMIEKTAGQLGGAELEEAFRRAHSLKGAARAVDLRSVEALAHRLETLFARVRQGVLVFDKAVAAVVQQVLDASEDCVTALGENRSLPDCRSALQTIERVLGIEPDAANAPEPETLASAPEFQPLEKVRVTAQNFDGLLRSAGGLLIESQRQDQVTDQLNGIARQIASLDKESKSVRRTAAASLRRLRGQREFSRVSSFLDSVDRQVRSLSRQTGAVCRLHQRSSWTMHHLGKQLQRDVWQARMVPAESLLEGYRKMVRDLAREQQKEVEFRAISTGVHVDRRVLDSLKDPLMHLLRNAVSHGIEGRQERASKGKSPEALVTLRVGAEGQRLTIAIEDDGRGVDLARVAEVAVQQRILSEQEAAHRSPQELARILFRPGFSTASSVTTLSGRGMGLSVVYEAVRRLQGEVDIRPAHNGGTCVHISVPLSISTQRLLLVSCGCQTLAIPIHGIERLYRIRFDTVQKVEGKPAITVNRQMVPLYSLQHLLSIEHSSASSGPDPLPVMVLHSKDRRVAIAVDAFLSEADAVIRDLGPVAAQDGKISSGILLDDGTIAFVLNPMELLETSSHPAMPSFAKPSEPAREQAAPSILVVDDSITTRTLERSILEAHGYRVRVAVDGMEALAQLQSDKTDLVIADIQMPRMDGFELLEAMKKDPNLSGIPVIVVTSLERREDQERGLALGADAYIVKRKFDQAELLAAIRQIL
jgi:two-component system, chemotaxis family, sensor kinase CheA